jgi:hypothetical protein
VSALGASVLVCAYAAPAAAPLKIAAIAYDNFVLEFMLDPLRLVPFPIVKKAVLAIVGQSYLEIRAARLS